jgi:hypothetical protein
VTHYTRRATDRPAVSVRRGFCYGGILALVFSVGRMEGQVEVGAFCTSWKPLHAVYESQRLETLRRAPLGLPFAFW